MTFGGACKISILADRQQVFIAPLLFLWLIIIHYILGFTLAPITLLTTGSILAVYQQFNTFTEDSFDGFFDHCRYNGLSPIAYAWAKSVSVLVGTLLPMTIALLISETEAVQSLLIFSQWWILSICISCILTFMPNSSPLNLLLGWLPLLICPFIFLVDFFNTTNGNSLLILLGCDTIIISAVCIPFTFHKS